MSFLFIIRRASAVGSMVFSIAGLCIGIFACNPDVRDGLGPIIPIPNVEGVVLRAGLPAAALKVEIRDEQGVSLMDVDSDSNGGYGFAELPAGNWEVKVSGSDPSDFDSISRAFVLADSGDLHIMPILDIHAGGATTLTPEPGELLPRPSPREPVAFNWELPELAINSARVNLYDEVGVPVWSSQKDSTSTAQWNGIGSEIGYRDQIVAGDNYTWRVKLELADGTEARLANRLLSFTGSLPEAASASGRVLRNGVPASDLEVALRDSSGVVLLQTLTGGAGEYRLAFVEPGNWEVKVSGMETVDFHSVSREFTVLPLANDIALPDLDIHAYGATSLAPADGAVAGVPTFFEPIEFAWTLPEGDLDWARVILYDANGETIWSSNKDLAGVALWNGIMNQGDLTGQFVGAGEYAWRVKVAFIDSMAARLPLRGIRFVNR